MKKHTERVSLVVTFGRNVRRLRREQEMSQEVLAEKAGVHRTFIGYIERAQRNIGLLQVERMAVALEVDVMDLLKPLPPKP